MEFIHLHYLLIRFVLYFSKFTYIDMGYFLYILIQLCEPALYYEFATYMIDNINMIGLYFLTHKHEGDAKYNILFFIKEESCG